MFTNIIPLTKLPLSKPQAYTYELGDLADEIKIGQMVEVPLYYRTVLGIVKELVQQAPKDVKYKKINKIVDQHPMLSSQDLKLAEFTSNYYYASLGLILKHLTPEPIKKKLKKLTEALAKMNLSLVNSTVIASEAKQSYENINFAISTGLLRPRQQLRSWAGPRNDKKQLLIGAPTERQQHYLKIIRQNLQQKKQILFLVPEIALLPQTFHWLQKNFGNEEVVLLHSDLSKSNQIINWRKAQTNSAKIFLGTRRAIFTPFYNLGHIIIDEEQNLSYKQWDMNPRYDARTVAKKKAELYNCSLTFGTASPSVKAYFSSPPAPLLSKERGAKEKGVSIVDMRDELKKGNYSIFSENLRSNIETALQNKQQAILFVNRRGASTFVMCRDCGHVIRCPRCNIALMEHAGKTLSCNHCNFKANSPVVCPQCDSHRIKGFGIGVEKVELELKQKFPQARVARLDTSIASRLNSLQPRYEEFVSGKIDILVGTQIALRLTSANLSLTTAINIDSILNFPDWQTDEKSWHILNQLCQRNDIDSCIIQTYNPGNKLLRLLTKNEWSTFYQQELKNRQALKYPPFVKMIKLICKSDDYDYLQRESAFVVNKLKKELPATQVIGPIKPVTEKIRNFWQRQVILKLDLNYKNGKIKEILSNLSNSWSIDVDPLT